MTITTDNSTLVREFYDAYNDREFDRAAALATDDYTFTMVPTGETMSGANGIRQYLEMWSTAFPDSTVEITNMVVSDDWVVVEFTGRGIHSGPLRTPTGDIPATGKQVELHFCDVVSVRDGKLAGGRTYFDMASMMRQLGLLD
ncbi:MAG TPA: ester cyclase [Thermomicrobiales bacterium]|nr:ester cyclase [Thermomicrobiales bacterium]